MRFADHTQNNQFFPTWLAEPIFRKTQAAQQKHEQMPNPNFHIIGAPKCGTNTIASWLKSHRAVRLIEPCDRENIENTASTLCDPVEALGMVSPWSLSSERAILEVVESSPEARFIVCLRNPIDMAWALHSDALASAREPIPDFSKAWEAGTVRRSCPDCCPTYLDGPIDYAGACALGSHLVRLTAFVDPHQIHLVFLDDILHSPKTVWADIQTFLEIDEDERTHFPLEERLVPIASSGLRARLETLLKSPLAQTLVAKTPWLRSKRAINGLHPRVKSLREMPEDLRRKVCDQLSDDIGLISALSGRDLAHWLC